MRVLIVGCGYVGKALAHALIADDHSVIGVVKTEESAALLQAEGIVARACDCSTAAGALQACQGTFEIVVFCLSSRGGDYQRTYVDGIRHTLDALKSHPPQLFLYTSSTSVYPQIDGSWVDESITPEPTHRNSKLLLETENILRTAAEGHFTAYVFRLSGIYGPGRHSFLDRVAQTQPPWPLNESWMNHVHRDDVVSAIAHLIRIHQDSDTKSSTVLNVTDNLPCKQQSYVNFTNEKLERSPPTFTADDAINRRKGGAANRRISNAALRKLGWEPQYPSFQEGVVALLPEVLEEIERRNRR